MALRDVLEKKTEDFILLMDGLEGAEKKGSLGPGFWSVYGRDAFVVTAIRQGQDEMARKALSTYCDKKTSFLQPLTRFVNDGDFDSALRLLKAGGYLNAAGKIERQYYTEDFFSQVVSPLASGKSKRFLKETCDWKELSAAAKALQKMELINRLGVS